MEDTPQRHARSAGDEREPAERRAGAQRHVRRAALYGYTATAFQFPDESTVADLTDADVRASIREAGRELGLGDEVDALLDALDGTNPEALEPAYHDLFGLPGDGGEYPVVPYEAEYTTDGDVGESQRRIATVVGLLERFGLEVSDSFDERQDHVAVELELMQLLAAQRAAALTEGENEAAQRLARAGATVLDEHLGDFVPAFAHAVNRAADDRGGESRVVYARAADLAAALVEADVARHPDPVAPGPGGGGGV